MSDKECEHFFIDSEDALTENCIWCGCNRQVEYLVWLQSLLQELILGNSPSKYVN